MKNTQSRFFFLLVAFLSISILVSCSPQHKVIEDLAKLTANVNENGDSFTEAEWNEVIQNYETITQQINQYQEKGKYTSDERREIARLQGVFAATCAKKMLNGDLLKQYLQIGLGAIEGFFDGLKTNEVEE